MSAIALCVAVSSSRLAWDRNITMCLIMIAMSVETSKSSACESDEFMPCLPHLRHTSLRESFGTGDVLIVKEVSSFCANNLNCFQNLLTMDSSSKTRFPLIAVMWESSGSLLLFADKRSKFVASLTKEQ